MKRPTQPQERVPDAPPEPIAPAPRALERGRGATFNPGNRYRRDVREAADDGWARDGDDEPMPPLATTVTIQRARTIIARNDSPDIGFDRSINPYQGCEHGCVYCLSGDTKVLLADGSTRPLADLRIGDEIVGTKRQGHYRRYVRTTVLAHWQTRKPAFRVELADGTVLVASADHRFLTERGWKFVARSPGAGQRPYLTLHNSLMGFGSIAEVRSARPLDEPQYRRGYLCGLIRGDGHLGTYRYERPGRKHGDQHRFRLAMADSPALHRAARYLADFGIGTRRFLFQEARSNRRPIHAIRTSARAAIAAIERIVSWPEQPEGDWARGFIAGVFAAEGSFSGGVLRIANSDPAMIETTKRCLAKFAFDFAVEARPRQPLRTMHHVRVRGGVREHMRMFRCFGPAIGRKRDFADQAVKTHVDLRVVAIEPLGVEQDLFDITTGTGDFVANGVISHNCYARPTHAYHDLSPGLDFETKLFAKPDAAKLLSAELARPGYACEPIALGTNTDPYQPIEREWKITRSVLEVLAGCEHPFTIVTKSSLVERDLDIIAPMAAKNMARVFVSITSLDKALARTMEPRAAAPHRRIETVRALAGAGVPTGVMVAPLIPQLNDKDLEAILEAAAKAGASMAGWVILRLPLEVAPLFRDWLDAHYPLRAQHVMSVVRQIHGGRDYDATFGRRQRGSGVYADLIEKRFAIACRRFGLNEERGALDTSRFRAPRAASPQLDLF